MPFYHNGYQREAFDPPPLDATHLLDAAYEDLFRNLLAPTGGGRGEGGGFYDAWRRKDHVFLFAHEFWGARKLWTQNHVGKSILLVVESNPLDMKMSPSDDKFIEGLNLSSLGDISHSALAGEEEYAEHCLDCFDARKDILVPQHIDYFALKKFKKNNRSYGEREWLYCFHGAIKHDLYERPQTQAPFDSINAAGIRQQLLSYIGKPRASVGRACGFYLSGKNIGNFLCRAM